MLGTVTIDGREYVERYQCFPAQLTVTVGLAVMPNLSVVLPGIAGFLLKGLTRQVVAAGAVAANLFRFRFGNSDGSVNYIGGGVGAVSDRVVDTLIFGNGQFPFPLIPPVFYTPTGSLLYEVEDLSNAVPYTIYFGFHGSFLLPV